MGNCPYTGYNMHVAVNICKKGDDDGERIDCKQYRNTAHPIL